MNLELLKQNSSARRYQDSEVIIRDGEQMGNEVFIILAGSVGVYKNYQQPNEIKLTELKPGSFFGEMTLFLNKERAATVVAHEPVYVLVIDRINIYNFFETQPELTYSLIKTLCQRLDDANKQLSGEDSAPESIPVPPPANNVANAIPSALKDLFPKGHKMYSYKAPAAEPDTVYNKSFTCPLCDEHFPAYTIRTTRLKVKTRDKDFRVRHEGIDATYLEIITCHHCCFSAFENSFNRGAILSRFAQNINKINVYKNNLKFMVSTDRDVNEVFAGYYLALKCANLFYARSEVTVAKIWARLMWLYRDCNDKDMEMFALEKAQESYLAVFKETDIDPNTMQQISVMIGELSLQLNDLDNAKTFFMQARTHRGGSEALIAQAEDGIQAIKEMSQF